MSIKRRLRLGLCLFLLGLLLCGLSLYKAYSSLNIATTNHDSIIEPMLNAVKSQGLIAVIALGLIIFIVGLVFLYSCLESNTTT